MADTNQTNYPTYIDPETERSEELTIESSVLSLPVEDKILVDIINKKVKDADEYFKNKLKLDARRQVLEKFWRGEQLDKDKIQGWQTPYIDNILYQDLETRISIAAGRMPDIIVTPGEDSPDKKESARQFEKILDIKVKSDVTKRLVKDGLRNMNIALLSAIKVRWDKNRGENGDFTFELVRPTRIGVDHTATLPHDGFTSDNMEIIYEWVEQPIGLVLATFPNKREELFRAIGIKMGTEKQMASKIKYQEVWFTWYDKEGKVTEGVCWKYKDLILDKIKNPYWDWEGYEQATGEVDMLGEPEIETFYRNHFDRPRKPYMFLSHQNLGKSPIEDTSPLEQALSLQRNINKRGRQITEIADRAIPKLAFAGEFITKEEARRVTNDPDEHIWLAGTDDARKALQVIPANPPPPILYQDLTANRARVDGLFATHGTTRGETVSQESGISKQITREGDLTISDDIVSIVVERVIYEMANWATQMMKVMYDKPHYIKELGKDGDMVYMELSRDMIEDGIAVNVKANSVDRATRRNDALNLARMKGIDPLTMFEDLDEPNPKERTKRLLAFITGQMDGYARYYEAAGLNEDLPAQQPQMPMSQNIPPEGMPPQPELPPQAPAPVPEELPPELPTRMPEEPVLPEEML